MKNANQIKFNPSGKLIIMQVSDPQDMKYVRPAMVKMLNNAYDAVKPDLVLFTGDNILGNHLLDARIGNRQIASGKEATLKVMRESIDNIAAPLQRRGIPFAMIFGNHDDRNLVSKDEQADIFRSYSCCLPMNIDDPTVDCDTYNIPVLDSEGKSRYSISGCWTAPGMTRRRINATSASSPRRSNGLGAPHLPLPPRTAAARYRR